MSVDLIIISDSKIQLSCGYSPPLQGNKPTLRQDITISISGQGQFLSTLALRQLINGRICNQASLTPSANNL